METSKRFRLTVERDSVCAGFTFEHTATLADALSAILAPLGYLANIAGGEATWIVESAGKPLAVVAQQWQSPQFLIEPSTPLAECVPPGTEPALVFRYGCQADPAVVFECLKSGRPLPDKYGGGAE